MHKYYMFAPEVVLFDGVKEYVIYIPSSMCTKMETRESSEFTEEKSWIYIGFHGHDHYYYPDEGCIYAMNTYLKVRGGGRIKQIVITCDDLLCPLVYPVRMGAKHSPLITKAIKDIK